MSHPLWSINNLLELLLECGRIGLHYFEKNQWWLKADHTLLTPADGEIEALLGRHFDRPAEHCRMLGEETAASRGEDYLAALLRGTAFVVDPIDGTAPFAHGLSYWGTSIGLMEAGKLVEGAVILPREGEIFISNGADVYWAQKVNVQQDSAQVVLSRVIPQPQDMTEGGMVALSQEMAKRGRFLWSNPVQVTGCAVNAILYVMLGRYLAYFGHIKLWDMAGAWPIIMKAGFEATLFNGTPLTATVDETCYDLAYDSAKRWSLRDGCLFAPRGKARELFPAIQVGG